MTSCFDYYYPGAMPFDEAKAAVAKLDPNAKQVELGRRVINRYGCFSCHEIKGFENTQPIGTELSEEGSKLVSRLDFAFVHDIPHSSKLEWFKAKLHDPRIFDQGRRAADPTRSCGCRTSTSRTRKSSG